MIGKTLHIKELKLESGAALSNVPVHYHQRGACDGSKPIVWTFHALTANSNPEEWWAGLFSGDGMYAHWDAICVNMLASPYGSCSPLAHGGMSFPLTTIRDTVNAQLAVASALNIQHVNTLLGGSCGGYQALEFAHAFTGTIDHMVLLATGAREMPWNKAIHEAMRLTLKADPTLEQGDGSKGLQAARAIGMLNYRTAAQFNNAQPDDSESLKDFMAPSYIRYHGQKLVDRFDAACYYKLTEQLDTHHIGRGRGGLQSALGQITVPTLVIGISSDVLIPVAVQEELATNLPNATLKVVDSAYGHDGFLIEYPQINAAIAAFYNE